MAWHPRCKSGGWGRCSLIYSKEDAEYESDTDGSDGATSLVESKVVAICVVSSFMEKSLHPDKPGVVPTILIDRKGFRVCFYDCERDILLLSNTVPLSADGHLSPCGVVFLWAVLNHR